MKELYRQYSGVLPRRGREYREISQSEPNDPRQRVRTITYDEETWLRRARSNYIEERWSDGDDSLPEGYPVTRPADLYSFLLHLQRTY
jgi:hypothetical protein